MNQIFENQKKFQKKIGKPFSNIDSKKEKDKQELSDMYVLTMVDEIVEFRNEYYQKAWKKEKKIIDYDKLQEELTDVWLFLINLTITWDISPEKLLRKIEEKQLKNFKRLQK